MADPDGPEMNHPKKILEYLSEKPVWASNLLFLVIREKTSSRPLYNNYRQTILLPVVIIDNKYTKTFS